MIIFGNFFISVKSANVILAHGFDLMTVNGINAYGLTVPTAYLHFVTYSLPVDTLDEFLQEYNFSFKLKLIELISSINRLNLSLIQETKNIGLEHISLGNR